MKTQCAAIAADTRSRLSPRELEVIALIADGMTDKLVAREMGIDPGTVKLHAYHVYKKLGVTRRISAALLYHGIEVRT